MTEELATQVKHIQAEINRCLAVILDEQVALAAKIDPAYKQLWLDIRKYLLRGGKRLRPILAVLGFQAANGRSDEESIYELALSLELIHAFLLIHDDLMDHDDRRYGGLNIIGQYNKRLSRQVHPVVARDVANSMAILAGDVLHGLAQARIAQLSVDQATGTEIATRVQTMIFEVAAGQQLDVLGVTHKQFAIKSILKVYRYKTARYSIVTPLQLGAVLAGADQDVLDAFAQYGDNLGLAFQLTDDLLGMFGSARTIGKPVVTDLKEGKQTVLMHYGFKFATPTQKAFLTKKFGNQTVTLDDHREVKKILTDNGARAKTAVLAADYAKAATAALDDISINGATAQQLRDFASYCVDRKY